MEEHSYNIISKYPKGNDRRKTYNIKYQVDNQPEIYEVTMIYVELRDEKPKYVFLLVKDPEYKTFRLAGNNPKYVETSHQKDIFIEEVRKFQKGGSYRKTHPIIREDDYSGR